MWDVVLEKIKNQKIMRRLKPKPNQNGISSNNGGRIMNRLNSLNYTAHWNWILKCKDFIVLYILLKYVNIRSQYSRAKSCTLVDCDKK